ncbi:MAG: hypothetical protein LBC07_06610 [Elusimicrobiota bacterium]|nr:hypothetical protein [Elusimicrobiota bacterium]
MLHDSFDISSMYKKAWLIFTKNILVFLALAGLIVLANLFFVSIGIRLISFILQIGGNAYLCASISKASLIAISNSKPTFMVLQNTKEEVLRFLIVPIIVFIGLSFGTLNTALVFLVIPITALFLPLPFILLNEKLTVVESVKKAFRFGINNFCSLTLFVLLSVLLCILGAMALGVGALAAMSVIFIAMALIYSYFIHSGQI